MSFNLYSISSGFFINSDGYVGILTGDPKYQLDVNGNCRISGDLNIGGNITGPNSFVSKNETGNFITKNIYGDVQLTGLLSGKNIISQKKGYGAGIYTFQKEISYNNSGNIFLISGQNLSPKIFDVLICGDKGESIRKYSVAHSYGGNVMTGLIIDYNSSAFDVAFVKTGNIVGEALLMNIKNKTNDPIPVKYIITLFNGGVADPQTIIPL